jgi:predicted Zn-dependent peptidase
MYHKSVLSNGIRVVSEQMPQLKSVSLGIWIGTGSRHESDFNHGISHFIEHLIFKGTTKRNAKEIAEVVDAVGGQINAFTAKEYTCFYMKVLDAQLDFAAELLEDMIFHSQFATEDIEKEREVVLEELHMYEDSPEELVHDVHVQQLWAGHPLGRNILGTRESIATFDRKMLLDYYQHRYQTENIVIAAAGNLTHDALVECAQRYYGHLQKGFIVDHPHIPLLKPTTHIRLKETEQVHMCLSTDSVAFDSHDIYGVYVLNNILGGSMSSRLFQSIREEKGLAYSVYSYPTNYSDSGLWTIYAGTRPGNAQHVLDLILENLRKVRSEGILLKELTKSKEQLKGTLLLGLESSGSRMSRIGRNELTMKRFVPLNEVVSKINDVTIEQIEGLIAHMMRKQTLSYTAIGPLKEKDSNKVIVL